jgi:multidrug efflux system outer membrane protein
MMSLSKKIIIASLFGALTVSSCKISSEAIRPQQDLPDYYRATDRDTLNNIGEHVWTSFYRDSLLSDLIQRAIENNLDRISASYEVDATGTGVMLAQSNFLPFINGGVRASVEKFGQYTMNGIGNDDTNRSESLPGDMKLPNPYPEMFAGVTFGWEANLWGKLSAIKQSAVSRYLASKEMRHGVTSMIVFSVADNYFELLGLDQRKHVLLENIGLQELALELVKIQKVGGKVNQLAVDQFESQLLHTKTLLVQVNQEILIAEAKLNHLMARYPAKIQRTLIENYDSLPALLAGDPDHLIFNRPDIREKEFNLASANADAMAARAAFYPSLGLAGAAGLSSLRMTKLLDLPGAAAYSIGANLTAPILQRKRVKALYERAKANQKLMLTDYQRTILNAYYEVYGVLNNCYNLNQQVMLKQQEAEVQRRAFNSSNDLFSVGYATYLEVITAQRRLLEVELELSDLKRRQLKSTALLYRALGGGWKDPASSL